MSAMNRLRQGALTTMMMLLLLAGRRKTIMGASAFVQRSGVADAASTRGPPRRPEKAGAAVRWMADYYVDDEGRRIRQRGSAGVAAAKEEQEEEDSGWENFDPTQVSTRAQAQPPQQERRYGSAGWVTGGGAEGWDDEDNRADGNGRDSAYAKRRTPVGKTLPRVRGSGGEHLGPLRRRSNQGPPRSSGGGGDNRPHRRDGVYNNRIDSRGGGASASRTNNNIHHQKEADDRKTNMRALELAGFDHLYGLASVLNALQSATRDFNRPEDRISLDELSGDAREHEIGQRDRKPEAQFSPWLFVQDSTTTRGTPLSSRSADKASQEARVLELAAERGIPIATVDKGVLNTLSNNRPHQGFVLRCGKLFLDDAVVTKLPATESDESYRPFWLVLDEVVDPQNFGALLRSAYFLGSNLGVLICSKNSAPPSPTVSAASAGALELLAASTIFSTSNLPRTLAAAEVDGFRIVGASSSIPKDLDVPLYNLQDLPVIEDGRPTVLVLGSEGHGLRTLVAKSCTEFVRIPAGDNTAPGVDSLNVSVTGGILLWHFLQPRG